MIIRVKHNPTILALELSTWKELHQIVTSHTDQNTKRLSCINLHDHTHQAQPNHLGVGVIDMERATPDGYITHRSKHENIIMHQPSWSYASSTTQPYWRWSYQHGKSYTSWLHQTPIKTRKDYHVSTFMIIRIKHNPTILALELSTWKALRKMVTSHTDQYTKRLSCINLHDYTHQAKPNHLGVGFINMERATQDGYITHGSIHEKFIMYQPSWSYASSKTQPSWGWSYQHGKATPDGYIAHRSKHEKIIMHQPSWSYASSINQQSWRWSYQHGQSYTRWLHQTPIKTRKDYHASTFMTIRVKHNPTILALELLTWKELRRMVTSQTDPYTKRLSCINLHDHTHQA